jgi:hypothetical protein
VVTDDREFPMLCGKSITLCQFLDQAEWKESSDQVITLPNGVQFEGYIEPKDDIQLLEYLKRCPEGRIWMIELHRDHEKYSDDDNNWQEWEEDGEISPEWEADTTAQQEIDAQTRLAEAEQIVEQEVKTHAVPESVSGIELSEEEKHLTEINDRVSVGLAHGVDQEGRNRLSGGNKESSTVLRNDGRLEAVGGPNGAIGIRSQDSSGDRRQDAGICQLPSIAVEIPDKESGKEATGVEEVNSPENSLTVLVQGEEKDLIKSRSPSGGCPGKTTPPSEPSSGSPGETTLGNESRSEEEEPATIEIPIPVQPVCLAPARLVQPSATAQVCDGEDAHQGEDSDTMQGKSASCTADVNLRPELETLKQPVSDTSFSKGSQAYRELQTQKRREREPRQAEFKPEMVLRETTAITTVIFRGEKSQTSKFSEHPSGLLWKHFHRWIAKFSGIPREDQKFAQFDDYESVALRKFKDPKSELFQKIGGRTLKLLAPSKRRRRIVHWRFSQSPATIPIHRNFSRPLRKRDISKYGILYQQNKEAPLLRLLPSAVGWCSPREHAREQISRKGSRAAMLNMDFIAKAWILDCEKPPEDQDWRKLLRPRADTPLKFPVTVEVDGRTRVWTVQRGREFSQVTNRLGNDPSDGDLSQRN